VAVDPSPGCCGSHHPSWAVRSCVALCRPGSPGSGPWLRPNSGCGCGCGFGFGFGFGFGLDARGLKMTEMGPASPRALAVRMPPSSTG
jgi:hypothetical protein